MQALQMLIETGKRLCLVAGVMTMVTAPVLAAEHETVSKTDLLAALTLAGHYCGEVTAVTTEGPRRYRVTCRTGSDLRVMVTEDNRLQLIDITTGSGQTVPGPEPHESTVRRHLFSIINLAGQNCDSVKVIERTSKLNYRVHCKNDSSFSVYLAADGRVVVEALN